jgi:hypothetical protein
MLLVQKPQMMDRTQQEKVAAVTIDSKKFTNKVLWAQRRPLLQC